MKTSNKLLSTGMSIIAILIILFAVYVKSELNLKIKEKFISSGVQVSKEINVSPFHSLEVNMEGDFEIERGSQKINVTADEALIKNLKFEVVDSVLTISSEGEFLAFNYVGPKVKIQIPEIQALHLLGNANIHVLDSFYSSKMTMNLSGSGDISSFFNANTMEIELLGSGNIENAGKVENIEASISGSGEIDCSKTETKIAKLSITGSGEISINVLETLDSEISGSGTISYLGNPKISAQNTGSGELRPLKK